MKRILIGLGGLLALAIILSVAAVLLLPVFVDSGALKTRIIEQVKTETGRTVAIDGDLGFSVFPRLAVDLSDLRLGEPGNPADQPSGTIQSARVSVSLFPLLQQELVVNGVAVEGADLEYRDEASDVHVLLRGLDITTGPLRLGERGPSAPVELELSTVLEDLVSEFSTELSLTGLATLDPRAQRYVLENLTLEATPEEAGAPLRMETPKLTLDLAAETASMEQFSLDKGPLRVDGQLQLRQLLTEPTFESVIETPPFSPRAVIADLGLDPIETTDPSVLESASLATQLSGTANQATLEQITLVLDDSRIEGTMRVEDFTTPALRFDFEVDRMNLDRYLPPAEEGSSGSSPSENGDAPVVIPVADLGAQDIEGTLRGKQLTLMGLELSDAELGLKAKDGVTRVHPLTAGFFGGRYSGDIRLDGRGEVPVIRFNERVESILFEQLGRELFGFEDLSGVALGSFQAEGSGNTVDQVIQTLQGSLELNIPEGALEGIDVWYEVRKAMARFKGGPAPDDDQGRTVFTAFTLDAALADGFIRTRVLETQLPFLNLDGDGAINLVEGSVDLGLTANVRDVPEITADPLASDLAGRSIPLRIQGDLGAPGVSVDIEDLLKDEATNQLFDRLGLTSDSEEGDAGDSDETIEAAKGLLKGLLGGGDDDDDNQ